MSPQPTVSAATTDAELTARAISGDEVAFECIMRRHNRLVFRTARGILKSDAETDEALQEAYFHAWQALATFRAESKLSTWLVRIVINEALGRLRRRGAQGIPLEASMDHSDAPIEDPIADDPDQRPEQIAMRGEIRSLLEARIDTLPDSFRIGSFCEQSRN